MTLLLQGGKPLKALAVDLGYSHWNLRDWKRLYGPVALLRSSEALELELRALRRENERLRAQRDKLRKRWSFWSNPGPMICGRANVPVSRHHAQDDSARQELPNRLPSRA